MIPSTSWYSRDDAARANRIVEKFNLTVVDTASIKEDIEKSREERGSEPEAPEKLAPEKSEDDKLLDELMEKPAQKEKAQAENPAAEKNAPFTGAAGEIPIRPRLSQRTAAAPQGVLLMGTGSLLSGRSCGTSRPSGRKRRKPPARGTGSAPEEGGAENHQAPTAKAQKEIKIEREVICDE